jgi:PIN domain nuclease of toxin-antitoxin system
VSRALLDTHTLLWWLRDDAALSSSARALIADPQTEPLASSVSVWEIAIKSALGKLEAHDDLLDAIADDGFSWLPVSVEHAWALRELPHHHGDPFDRLLIAQALTEDVPLVSTDRRFDAYGVKRVW